MTRQPDEVADVPVVYTHDRLNNTWTYVIEHPLLVGGPCSTRIEAQRHAVNALCRWLQQPKLLSSADGEIGRLRVSARALQAEADATAAFCRSRR